MIKLIVKRPNGDGLWEGDAGDGTLTPNGVFVFEGGAQPIMPPYSIEVVEEEEDDGSSS